MINYVSYYNSRFVPKLISWLIKREYHLEAQIGRINITRLKLHDILIKKKGFSIVSKYVDIVYDR